METEIKMVAVASKVFSYKKKHPDAIIEEVFLGVADFINDRSVRDESTKIAMIASVNKACDMADRNRSLTEKELLKRFIEDIPQILMHISR